MNQMRIYSITLHPRSQSIRDSWYSLWINLEVLSILNELIFQICFIFNVRGKPTNLSYGDSEVEYRFMKVIGIMMIASEAQIGNQDRKFK